MPRSTSCYFNLFALALIASPALAADVVLQCPEFIHTTQAHSGQIPSGWKVYVEPSEGLAAGVNRHPLAGVLFSVGEPEQRVFLKPEPLKSQAGRPRLTRIELEASDELYQTCQYLNTAVQVTQKVGTGFARCDTQWDLTFLPAKPKQTTCTPAKR